MNRSRARAQHFSLRSPANENESGIAETSRRSPLVLLIEDSRADALLVREALEDNEVNADLVVLPDGETALAYLEDSELKADCCPALVIIDLNLPRIPGRVVLAAVRRGKCSSSYAVVFSSSDAAADRSEAMRLGADRYLLKPLDLAKFFEIGRFFKEILESRPSY